MRVLVIDDSKAMRMITARELWSIADADEMLEAASALAGRDLLGSAPTDELGRAAFAALHAAPAVAGAASEAGA